MKTTCTLALLTACAIIQVDTSTWAQGRPQRPSDRRAPRPVPSEQADLPDSAIRQALLDTYDLDKDGRLDAEERAQVKADIDSGKIQAPGRTPRGGAPGAHVPPPEILEKYDVNKDGKLDATEREAVHADMESGKLARPAGRPEEAGHVPPAGGPLGRKGGRR